jgi:hypothetical protein
MAGGVVKTDLFPRQSPMNENRFALQVGNPPAVMGQIIDAGGYRLQRRRRPLPVIP